MELLWEGTILVTEKLKQSLIATLGLAIVFVFIGFNIYTLTMYPVDRTSTKEITVAIPKGSSTNSIGTLLKKEDLIRSEAAFKIYAKLSGYDVDLKAGKFILSKNMDLKEIMQKLVNGDAVIESVRFTIPEGYTVKQIAEKLAAEGIVNEDKFLELAKNGDFDYDFIKQIPNDKNIHYKLEGYLFPETYEVKKGASERVIINTMLSQFQKEWNPEWDKALKEKNKTLPQILTLASIIEREVSVDKERPIVSGVLYNRMNINMRLQVDATIQYILGKQKSIVTYDDLKIDDPYNTYRNYGLPPGPISNPGRESIKAAIFPEKNNYLFYVTKKDNSGEHYFSKTYQEHLYQDDRSRK